MTEQDEALLALLAAKASGPSLLRVQQSLSQMALAEGSSSSAAPKRLTDGSACAGIPEAGEASQASLSLTGGGDGATAAGGAGATSDGSTSALQLPSPPPALAAADGGETGRDLPASPKPWLNKEQPVSGKV